LLDLDVKAFVVLTETSTSSSRTSDSVIAIVFTSVVPDIERVSTTEAVCPAHVTVFRVMEIDPAVILQCIVKIFR
jgi:hypothetical protein